MRRRRGNKKTGRDNGLRRRQRSSAYTAERVACLFSTRIIIIIIIIPTRCARVSRIFLISIPTADGV